MRRRLCLSKPSLFFCTIVLLWLKTYTAYRTGFHIPTSGMIEAVILLINPGSFLLCIAGLCLFMKEKSRRWFLLTANLLLSFVLYANLLYYRFFTDFLTLPVLFQSRHMGELGASIGELASGSDIFYFVDVPVLAVLLYTHPSWFAVREYTRKDRKVFYMYTALGALLNLGLAEAVRPQLLTRSFDRAILVKNIGTYNYQIYDAVLQSKTTSQRVFADSSKLSVIEQYLQKGRTGFDPALFGKAAGRNIIVVSMESLQSFVLNARWNGEEITPFLNRLAKESYYFPHFYHQTGQGKTSDAEFLAENSLYPLSRGAVFFTHAQNSYQAAPSILKKAGYYTAALHANNKSFWNRDMMYQSIGYDQYYDLASYQTDSSNSINWGLKDKAFFRQSILHLQKMPQPFYAKFITLSNHFPYIIDERDRSLPDYDSSSKTLNRYFPSVRYMDEALEQFVADLKAAGLYENSVLIFYGDHYGISENHYRPLSKYLGRDITPFEAVQLQRVPLFIHVPGLPGGMINRVGGQVDLLPTLLHLIGDDRDYLQFGHDLFAPDRTDFAVLRNGSFITKDYVYTPEACYNRQNGSLAEPAGCMSYIKKAAGELKMSDRIVNGDLFRFRERE